MNQINVQIKQLDAMRVLRFHAFGASPEEMAWQKLVAWAKPKGWLGDKAHRIFGFNNPNPSAGSPNYGYEFWLELGLAEVASAEVEVQDFGGGLYAVTRCQGVEQIGPTWHKLAAWAEDSAYRMAPHQWLEEHLPESGVNPAELRLALYLPIAE